MNKYERFWPFRLAAVIKSYFSNTKEKCRLSASVLEILKLQLSVALVLTLSNLHYKGSHIFCPWKASGINCVCDLSVISNLLSIISSPRGPGLYKPSLKMWKKPMFLFFLFDTSYTEDPFQGKTFVSDICHSSISVFMY